MDGDGWLLIRSVEPTPDGLEIYIDRTIKWNLAGCERCSSVYEVLKAIPAKCDKCGERNKPWMDWVTAAAWLAKKAGVVYTISPVERSIDEG